MKSALEIDAYDKPFFSRAGDFIMYLIPPNTNEPGGFGDLSTAFGFPYYAPLVKSFAVPAGNPYWNWYAERGMETPVAETSNTIESGVVRFTRSSLEPVEKKAPMNIAQSKCFGGVGQAVLNTTLLTAQDNVQIVFKSSPFGTQSHGYESNNSFNLSAFGERLLIRSGYRDNYGSPHHKNWMWSTRSVNNITVNGISQVKHSGAPRSQGEIVGFHAGDSIDIVAGEAGGTYWLNNEPQLSRYTRSIIFVKPELIVVYDRLKANQDSTFQYWLHSLSEFDVRNNDDIRLQVNDACCVIQMLKPVKLSFSQTNKCDPPPMPHIKLNHSHLTAETSEKTRATEFVTLIRPYRNGHDPPTESRLEDISGGYILHAKLTDGQATLLLPTDDSAELRTTDGLISTGCIAVRRTGTDGSVRETVRLDPKD